MSTDDIAGRVIAAKGFDGGDAIMRGAIREQAGSTVKRLHREGMIENIGSGRAGSVSACASWRIPVVMGYAPGCLGGMKRDAVPGMSINGGQASV